MSLTESEKHILNILTSRKRSASHLTASILSVITAILLFSALAALQPHAAYAEGFERIQYNNPGLTVDLGVGLWAWPLPMDFDGDGDNDLLVSCPDKPYNGTYFFENPGDEEKPLVFKPAVRIGKGFKNIQVSYVDGKPRILLPGREIVDFLGKTGGFGEKTVEIYPATNVHEKGKKIRANQWKYSDYEGDGDLDLIVGVGDWSDYGWDNAFNAKGEWTQGPLHGYVYLIRNQGTTTKPDYAKSEKITAGEKNNPIDVYGMPSPNLADFDGDGDLDIICGEFVDDLTSFENIGTRKKPFYKEGKTYRTDFNSKLNGVAVLKMNLCMIVPTAFDWDKDGDMDLVVGQEDGRVYVLDNDPSGHLPFIGTGFLRQEARAVKFGALVTPFSIDWDSDGDQDLICGNTAGKIGFIENLNGDEPPKWTEPRYLQDQLYPIHIMAGTNGSIQGPCEAKWGYTTLNVADWNHDGFQDIVVNSIWGKVVWYGKHLFESNELDDNSRIITVHWQGKAPKPAWNWWDPEGNELATQWRTTPVVIDLDKDGLNDLVMLDREGYLAFFKRLKPGENVEADLAPGKRIFEIEDGPSWFDSRHRPLNKKPGLLRLNAGEAGKSGRRKFCFADWDQDGRLDLLVNSVNVNFLRNVSEEKGRYLFRDMGPVDDRVLAGHTTSPCVVDWDKNGVPDLLVGGEDGFLYYLKNPNAQ